MHRILVLGAVALGLGGANAGVGGPSWTQWEPAKGQSAATGKPILVYSTVDEKGNGCWGGTTPTDRAFGDAEVSKRFSEFILVKCSSVATAKAVGAKRPPELIFFRPDGEEYFRTSFKDVSGLQTAINESNTRFAPKEISWAPYDEAALQAASGKLVILAFVDAAKDSESTLKALEDRNLVKFHEKIVFLKAEYRNGSDEAKKWGVSTAPTLIFIDPSKTGTAAVLERATGKRKAAQLGKPIDKHIKAIEKK